MVAIAPVGPTDPTPVFWTQEEFLEMMRNANFGDRHFELLGGVIFEKMSDNKPHRFGGFFAMEALQAVFGKDHFVTTNASLPLTNRDVPEPDVIVYGGTLREMSRGTVREASVRLLVEVVDIRLDTALHKRGVYALALVPEYWIIDVNRRTVIVHRDPFDGTYRDITEYSEGAVPVGVASVLVEDLLPPVDLAD